MRSHLSSLLDPRKRHESLKTHDARGVSSGAALAAKYTYWAHQELETSTPEVSTATTANGGSTACTTDGSCVVVAGEFARFTPLYANDGLAYQYVKEMGHIAKYDHYKPAIWAYHGYDDITATAANGSNTKAMVDAESMEAMFQHSPWKPSGHIPPIWETEGADALVNGNTDSGDVSTDSATNCDPTPDYTGIKASVDRYLAMTTGTPGSSGLKGKALTAAGDLAVAFYYEIGPGGSGPGGAYDACGYSTAGGFDSSLFESPVEAQKAGHTVTSTTASGATTQVPGVHPRPAYCYLANITSVSTTCDGVNVPDPEPYGDPNFKSGG